MKKLLTVILVLFSFASIGQVVTRTYDITYANGLFGQKQIDTIYTLARTPLVYWNGYGNFVSLDSSRYLLSMTNLTGANSYTTSTGVFNIHPSVDSIYRTVGKDSLQFTIDGRYHAVLDSAGGGGGGTALSAITAGTGANTINSSANKQIWQWNSLVADTGMVFQSGSTAATSTSQVLLSAKKSGANANASVTTTAASFENTSTGTTGVNVAAYFSASGGTNNYAGIFQNGSVGIGTNAPARALHVSGGTSGATVAIEIQHTNTTSNSVASLILANSASKLLIATMYPTGQSVSLMAGPSYGALASQAGSPLSVYTVDTSFLRFGTNSTEYARFSANLGHLLIGTTTDIPASISTTTTTTAGVLIPRVTKTQRGAILNGFTASIFAGGTGYTNGTSAALVNFTGGSGTGATGIFTVAGTIVTGVYVFSYGSGYVVGDTLSATIGAGTGFKYVISALTALPAGLKVYNTTDSTSDTYDGGQWMQFGHKIVVPTGYSERAGQVALVSGTKAITITGVTTSSLAFVTLVSPSGATLTVQYQAVCTSNTLTIQANLAATTINTADGSTLNYWVIN